MMKSKLLVSVLLFLFVSTTGFAAKKTEKIAIKGNCDMCEKRIERAAYSVKGVIKADWDVESKTFKVTYNDKKTTLDKIETAIANVGHDTPNHKASDEVYNNLHSCCKYER